jgi:hypothetical protein
MFIVCQWRRISLQLIKSQSSSPWHHYSNWAVQLKSEASCCPICDLTSYYTVRSGWYVHLDGTYCLSHQGRRHLHTGLQVVTIQDTVRHFATAETSNLVSSSISESFVITYYRRPSVTIQPVWLFHINFISLQLYFWDLNSKLISPFLLSPYHTKLSRLVTLHLGHLFDVILKLTAII